MDTLSKILNREPPNTLRGVVLEKDGACSVAVPKNRHYGGSYHEVLGSRGLDLEEEKMAPMEDSHLKRLDWFTDYLKGVKENKKNELALVAGTDENAGEGELQMEGGRNGVSFQVLKVKKDEYVKVQCGRSSLTFQRPASVLCRTPEELLQKIMEHKQAPAINSSFNQAYSEVNLKCFGNVVKSNWLEVRQKEMEEKKRMMELEEKKRLMEQEQKNMKISKLKPKVRDEVGLEEVDISLELEKPRKKKARSKKEVGRPKSQVVREEKGQPKSSKLKNLQKSIKSSCLPKTLQISEKEAAARKSKALEAKQQMEMNQKKAVEERKKQMQEEKAKKGQEKKTIVLQEFISPNKNKRQIQRKKVKLAENVRPANVDAFPKSLPTLEDFISKEQSDEPTLTRRRFRDSDTLSDVSSSSSVVDNVYSTSISGLSSLSEMSTFLEPAATSRSSGTSDASTILPASTERETEKTGEFEVESGNPVEPLVTQESTEPESQIAVVDDDDDMLDIFADGDDFDLLPADDNISGSGVRYRKLF